MARGVGGESSGLATKDVLVVIGGAVMIMIGFWIVALVEGFIDQSSWTTEQNSTFDTIRTLIGAMFIISGVVILIKVIRPALKGF